MRGYLNLVKNGFKDDVGKCGPLSNVYNNTLVATCDKIMNPWVNILLKIVLLNVINVYQVIEVNSE